MAPAESSPASAPRIAPAELRQLWEGGQRGKAIRAALEGWEQLTGQGGDLGWLPNALRSCGLKAEAFALQAQMTRFRGEKRQWEALIRSVLQSGDPWWARDLLEEAGSSSRELQALRIEVELALGELGDASALISAWVRDHA